MSEIIENIVIDFGVNLEDELSDFDFKSDRVRQRLYSILIMIYESGVKQGALIEIQRQRAI